MHTDKEIKADNSILRDKRVNKYLCSKRVSEIPDFSFVDARNVKWLEIRENIRSLRFGFGCNGVEVLLLRRWEMHSYTTILPAAAVSPIFS